MKTLILIPVFEESASIATVIKKTIKMGWDDILVIDDCSGDETCSIAIENGVKLIHLPVNIGAWGAIQTGMAYALDKGYSRVVTIDGDDQHEPEYIKPLLEQLKVNEQNNHDKNIQGSDVVIGSCPERGSRDKALAWYILKKLSGLDFLDLTSGFRAYNSLAMKLLLSKESMILDHQDIGVLLLCKKNNLKIAEVGVLMNPREKGISKIYKNTAMVIKYLLSTLFLIGVKRW